MRLDPTYLAFITREQLRVLVAIEMGMKNHEYVPVRLINSIANLKSGDCYKIIRQMLKLKFISHVGGKCDGYKLNYLGYDYLALQTFIKRGTVTEVVAKIGVGKQSDIYKCIDSHGQEVVLKFARLGRASFRTIKKNRDYIKNRTSYNWLYLSRLSTQRQITFMKILHSHGFPTPIPIDSNRHGIVMSLIDGVPLHHIKQLDDCESSFKECMQLLKKFAEYGLIHGDFNEFNIMMNLQDRKITVIDFPQCVSTQHYNAEEYFNRDVECIYMFFEKLREKSDHCEKNKALDLTKHEMPILKSIEVKVNLDNEVKASGYYDKRNFSETDMKNYEEYQQFVRKSIKHARNEIYNEKQQQQQHSEDQESEEEDAFLNNLKESQAQEFKQAEGETEDLAKDLQMHFKQLEPIEKKQDAQSDQQEEEEYQGEQRFRGMTDYQIRQILKKEREQQRQQKKREAKDQTTFIKEIVRKKAKEHKRVTFNKNKGNIKVELSDYLV